MTEAKRKARQSIMPIDGVEGVGLGDGTIRVYVRDNSVTQSLPRDVEGVPVEVVLVGEITPY